MKKATKIILVLLLIVVLGVVWNWFLDCKTKCKILPGEAWACKEKCFEDKELNASPWWFRLYILLMRNSKDCYPKECCCHMLE